MTVNEFININYIERFRIVTFRNWKTETVYDSSRTAAEIPTWIYESIVETVGTTPSGIIEIEI